MGSTSDKFKGNANEAAGKIKKGVGKATDNPNLKGEGRAQESRGKAQQVKGEVKDSLKRGIDRT
ncbi:CsbD family protein [Azotobacter armeniacus]